MHGDYYIGQYRQMLQPIFLTPLSSVHLMLYSHCLLCLKDTIFPFDKYFEPLIAQTFLFLVTPCLMPISLFLFPLKMNLSVGPMGLSSWIISELFLDLLMDFKLFG